MIRIQHVSKKYGRRVALADVSLEFRAGEITLLLGSNGAGKSTLLRCLLGITDFDGTIRVAGLDPLSDGCAVRSLVGYMPQTGGLHADLTVAQTMDLYAAIRSVGRERGRSLLEEASLAGHLDAHIGDLSGGMQQRLGFALALLTDPPILLLDEPSASLDAASREWLAGRLHAAAAEGRVVIVSTHSGHELLEGGHRRVVLEEGRVIHADAAEACGSDDGHGRPLRRGTAGRVAPLIAKEIRDALGNRWLLGYAAVLGALGLAAAITGIESSSGLAVQAFGRTTATLMNLCLLLSPLVAVLMGAASLAGERERGTLEHLLAQPFTRRSLLLAKHAALLVSLSVATVAGFLPAGVLVAWHAGAGPLAHYLLFPALASVVAAAMAGLGMLISVSSRTAAQAQATGIFAWFGFVLLYDLVLMGSLALGSMPAEAVAVSLMLNPVDAGRVLGVLALEPDLYLLGPAGAYLAARFSPPGTALLLAASLAGWAIGPIVLAIVTFNLPGSRRTRPRHARPRSFSLLRKRPRADDNARILTAPACGMGVGAVCGLRGRHR